MGEKRIKNILDFVRRTNPEITEKKLIEELLKSSSSAMGLIVAQKNQELERR